MPNISNIIIDEACQSVEPESIIPIVFNPSCTSYVLVGDPQQLPATVLSKFSTEHNYTQSLMERMLKANFPKIMVSRSKRY
jgi:senataxin